MTAAKRPTGDLLYRVALISDTHVNEREDFSASPYPANAEANPRARHALAQIEAARPDLAIHLGDMVNPVPELASYAGAAERFRELASALSVPLHLMPGNHDIGDKPVSWMPAGMVSGEHIALYREHFGADRFSVDLGDCHFVILNSPLINSGDPAEAEQAAWLEQDLAEHADRRVFLFSHYPPYVSSPDEPGSYDNIDEPGRSWLLDLIRRHRPEALFSAHVHNFWYDRIGETEFYVVPSTCFIRHDYSEMYRIDGGDQRGRNDAAKLGHVTLEIFERGHVAHYHRSYGATLAEGAPPPPAPPARPHAKTAGLTGLWVDMRHAWAEEMVVAPSGAVDEFGRKTARNDYPLMAMWEMGLRGLRIPLHDLADPRLRRRMALMTDVGHRFRVYRYGLPDEKETALLADHAGLVAEFELVLEWDKAPGAMPAVAALGRASGLPLILSRVNRKDAAKTAGGRFNHLISHGFGLAELDELEAFLGGDGAVLDGVQVTIPRSVDPWPAARTLGEFASRTGKRPVLYVKSTEASPAESFDDDVANARRFAAAAMAAIGFGVDVILDTFDDADRGYFCRTGLVDRRFNPRLAGQLLSALVLATNDGGWRAAEDEAPALVHADGRRLLVADRAETDAAARWTCPATGAAGPAEAIPPSAAPLLLVEQRG